MEWAEKRGIAIEYIQPGKPQQNAYIERYNRTVRHEWLWTYNNDRPNMAIGGITPAMKLKTAASILRLSPIKNGGITTPLGGHNSWRSLCKNAMSLLEKARNSAYNTSAIMI